MLAYGNLYLGIPLCDNIYSASDNRLKTPRGLLPTTNAVLAYGSQSVPERDGHLNDLPVLALASAGPNFDTCGGPHKFIVLSKNRTKV